MEGMSGARCMEDGSNATPADRSSTERRDRRGVEWFVCMMHEGHKSTKKVRNESMSVVK